MSNMVFAVFSHCVFGLRFHLVLIGVDAPLLHTNKGRSLTSDDPGKKDRLTTQGKVPPPAVVVVGTHAFTFVLGTAPVGLLPPTISGPSFSVTSQRVASSSSVCVDTSLVTDFPLSETKHQGCETQYHYRVSITF